MRREGKGREGKLAREGSERVMDAMSFGPTTITNGGGGRGTLAC